MDDSLLCDLVGHHPSLYDPKHKYCKDQRIKDNVWKEIAGILKQPVDECKKRWKNIRDTFNKRKRTEEMGTGSARDTKVSKWYLNDVLSFLNSVARERQSTSNIDVSLGLVSDKTEDHQPEPEYFDQSQEEESSQNATSSKCTSLLSRKNLSECNAEKRKNDNLSDAGSNTEHYEKQKETKPIKRQKITEKVLDLIKANADARLERHTQLVTAIEHHNSQEDPVDAFFRSMAGSVKKLSPASQIKAKMEICRIVGELELSEILHSSVSPSDRLQPYSRPSTSFSIHSPVSDTPSEAYEPQMNALLNRPSHSVNIQIPISHSQIPLSSNSDPLTYYDLN